MGRIIKRTAYFTKDADSIGCAKLVVFANAVEDNPFMTGAFHGIGETDFNTLNKGNSFYAVRFNSDKSNLDDKISKFKDYLGTKDER